MPPRPAAPCSRALRRQLTSGPDNIWISDSLLAQAFERYCVVSREARRRACNVPGPLESRRRLGKRSIGGLNALQNPSGLPDWSLPVLDLSKWTWEPATPLSLRQERFQEAEQSTGWTSLPLPRWLAEWIQPGDEETEITSAGPVEGKSAVFRSKTSVGLLDEFQSLVHSGALEEVVLACDALCERLGSDNVLFFGLPEDKNEVLDSLDNLWVALNARFGGSSNDAVSLFAQVYSSLLASDFTKTATLEAAISHRLLVQLARIPASDALCQTLELIMRAVAPAALKEMESTLLDVLNKFFVSWGQDIPSQSQIELLAGALSVIEKSAAKPLLRQAQLALLVQAHPAEKGCHARYAWLSILARTSAFKFTEFAKALAALFGKPTMAATISSRDICELLLDNWSSNRRLQHPRRVRDIYQRLTSDDDSLSSGALAYALYTCDKHWEAKIVQLRDCLRTVGHLADFSTSFKRLAQLLPQQDQRLPPRLLRRLLPLCRDHRAALQLHNLYAKLPTSSKERHPKDSSVWEKYLLAAVSDSSTHAAEVCKLLKLCKKNDQTTTVAERLAYSFANSDQLDDRAALRYVTECARFLVRGGDKLPTMALEAIYRVVTRDLTRADWGRTSRLRWLVNTVHRECGPEMADKVAVMLHRWRTNIGTFKAREQRRLEQEERELELREQLRDERRVLEAEQRG